MRKRSVILLSGGLDSAANLAMAHENDEPVLALTIRYGQRASEREVRAARKLCQIYSIRHEIVDLPWIASLGGSALTQSSQRMPHPETSQLDDPATTLASAKAVWVPNRNGVFVNVGAAFAESMGATRIVVGFNREEAATFPDNSLDFLNEASRALRYSTANHVEVFSYTVGMDKTEIVAALRNLHEPFPFEEIWSCYEGGETPCGICESCRRLNRALATLPKFGAQFERGLQS